MAYTNNNGQTRVGIRSGVLVAQTPSASTLWNSIYAVYNGDSVGSQSLKTSLYAVYNGESNTNDSFGTNNGTAVGGLTYTTGKIGDAFTFNGTNAYVNLPDNSIKSILSGDFSISCWFYPTDTSNVWRTIINCYSGSGGAPHYGFELSVRAGVEPMFGIYNGYSSSSLSRNNTFNINQWNHVVITRKYGVGTKMYYNGSLVTSNTDTLNPGITSVMNSAIGAFKYTYIAQIQANGNKIDALNIWQKELTPSEVSELYNSGNGSQYIGDSFYRPTTGDGLYNNNGTAQGGLTYGLGKVGTAFQFNGTNAYVTLPSDTLTPTGDFSISLWFNTNSASTERHIISNVHKQGGAAGQWKGWDIFTYASKVYFRLCNTNVNSDVISTTTISNSTWYHVTVTKSGTTQKIYINGALEATNNSAVTQNYTSPNYPVIGAQFYHTGAGYDTSTLFNGKVDAVSYWDKALTQSEITELYNSGNGKQYVNTNIITKGLILNLDASNTSSYSGTGTTWTNLVGGSYNATLYNGVGYTSTNSGGLTFDGVNDYVLLNSANKPSTTSANSGFSFGMWFNLNGWSSGKGILQIAYPNSLTSTTPTFLINTVNTDQIQYYIGGAGWAGSTTLTNKNAPQYFAFTVSSDSSNVTILKVYINGVYQFTVNNPFDLGTFNNKDIYIGNGYNGFMSMNCYSVHMYNNKTLTDAEVLQNYINTKSRFGL